MATILKKIALKIYLSRWAKNHAIEGHPGVRITRKFGYPNKNEVDLYWHFKNGPQKGHTIFERYKWNDVRKGIATTESGELVDFLKNY